MGMMSLGPLSTQPLNQPHRWVFEVVHAISAISNILSLPLPLIRLFWQELVLAVIHYYHHHQNIQMKEVCFRENNI